MKKIGKTYNVTTNYMIFPNKKLKMNTPLEVGSNENVR